MPIRVLATFPEIPIAPPVSHDQATSIPAAADASAPAASAPADAAGPPLRPSVTPAPRTPRRVRSRASFPGASVAALAVVAAAIWSLIAIREAQRPAAPGRGVRIAVEPPNADATEATLR